MVTASPYKVHVKLGQTEFSAEGPEETVKKHLAEFLEAAPRYTAPAGRVNGHSDDHANGNGKNGNGNGHAGIEDRSFAVLESAIMEEAKAPSARETAIDPALLKRLFLENREGLISLRTLPNETDDRTADTLFLILLGHRILKDQSTVMAGDLLVAARQSGIALSRIDSTMEKYRAFVTKGGSRRGSRYALTNPGIQHAEELALRMFN